MAMKKKMNIFPGDISGVAQKAEDRIAVAAREKQSASLINSCEDLG
jgi:hypothetical protein